MYRELKLVQREGTMSLAANVMQYAKLGWKLYESPFELSGVAVQPMVRDDEFPAYLEDAGKYFIVEKTGQLSVEKQAKDMKAAGWLFYGGPFSLNGLAAQAMSFGNMPRYVALTSGASVAYNELKVELDRLKAMDELQDAKIAELVDKVNSAIGGEPAPDLTPRLVLAETAISNIKTLNTQQDAKLLEHTAALLGKAGLVNGKVPYEQLPEFPVGRKVNVANQAARYALEPYADLTISYQSDTGDAWGLDANDDPAIEANWSKLGNAQALGVASFNGRTGNIAPQVGDYNTSIVAEVVGKRYVTEAQITLWNSAPTLASIDAKIATQKAADDLVYETKSHATATFIPVTQKGVAGGVAALDAQTKISNSLLYRGVVNGVAGLDANAKVPIAQLPSFMPQQARKWVDVKASRSYNAWANNTSGNDMVVFIRTNAISDNAKYVLINMRENSTAATMAFSATYDNTTGNRYLAFEATVPAGWQYAVQIAGGTVSSTMSNIAIWRELS